MFTDIRNFTLLTESVEPEAVVSFLNEYFTEMVDIVFRYGGTLDKYIGDGLMAVFGAPLSVEDAPKRAVIAAIEMVQALERMNQRKLLGGGEIQMGVGIATGTVISGNIGSLQRMEYTCIGDTVNTAARPEQFNKELGSKIIICQTTFATLDDCVPAQPTGALSIRGKSRQVHPLHRGPHGSLSGAPERAPARAPLEGPSHGLRCRRGRRPPCTARSSRRLAARSAIGSRGYEGVARKRRTRAEPGPPSCVDRPSAVRAGAWRRWRTRSSRRSAPSLIFTPRGER